MGEFYRELKTSHYHIQGRERKIEFLISGERNGRSPNQRASAIVGVVGQNIEEEEIKMASD